MSVQTSYFTGFLKVEIRSSPAFRIGENLVDITSTRFFLCLKSGLKRSECLVIACRGYLSDHIARDYLGINGVWDIKRN